MESISIYSIDKTPLKIKKGKSIEVKLRNNRWGHPYDLDNLNLYDEKGNILKQPPQEDYDSTFFGRLNKAVKNSKGKTEEEIVNEYLEHHYTATPQKELFRKHLLVALERVNVSPPNSIQELVKSWISFKNFTATPEQLYVRNFRDYAKKYPDTTERDFIDSEIDMVSINLNKPGELKFQKQVDVRNKFIHYRNYLEDKKRELEGRFENESQKQAKEKFTHKQQILLLYTIGFFDLPEIESLTTQQKGILIGHLLNRDEKNSEDYVRSIRGKLPKGNKANCKTDENKKKINELRKKVGLEDHQFE